MFPVKQLFLMGNYTHFQTDHGWYWRAPPMNRSCRDLGARRMGIKDVEAVQEASLVPAICSKMLFFFGGKNYQMWNVSGIWMEK